MAISIEDARRLVLEHVTVLDAEKVALDDALDRVLAEDAVSPGDVPVFDSSAMDGYAVHARDTRGAPVTLRLLGEARAGAPAQERVEPGTAMRISTGATMPEGADAIVRQELTADGGDGRLHISQEVAPGTDVRPAGEDVPKGATVLRAGTLLGPIELGVLASIDIARPLVARRPAVALVGTGDELVDPGQPLPPGGIRDSNGPALTAAVRREGGAVVFRERVGDDLDDTTTTLGAGLEAADVLITVGGVSVGPHDHVRPALARLEVEEVFSGVDARPGSRVTFGLRDDGRLVFALPGNPVSAHVAFGLFVVGALHALQGRSRGIRTGRAVADGELRGGRGTTTMVRCRAELRPDGWHVVPTQASQNSNILTSMLGVDALARVPAGVRVLPPGESVDIEFVS